MKSRLLTCSLRSLHDGVFVEDVRDAAAEQVHNTAAEQVPDAMAEQVRDATAVEQERDATAEQERDATAEQERDATAEQVHDATAVEQERDATAVEQERDATAVEQERDATAEQERDATAEQVHDTTGEQRKRQMAERTRAQDHGAKRREEEPELPIERVDGVEPYPLNAEDRLPYTPVLVNRIQRKTWLLTLFPERVQTEEQLDEIVRELVEYLLQPGNTQRVLVGVERCPRTGRLHAHVYIDFLRSTRMTRRLRTIQLPGEASVLHPHIDSVTGNRAELHVIKYVLKKETKVYGGILGREETALSHCRLIFISGPANCGKTTIARDFAVSVYGAGNGLPFYMKPVSKWRDGYRGQPVASLWPACGQPVASLWPACGQPVASLDDPGVRRFRELEQEVKVCADRYPFIAELKDHSIRAKPEWLVVASNYPLEELTNAFRNPTFYQTLFRRTDDGRRLFHFTTHCYNPDTIPVDAETRRHYHRRLERFVEIVVNSH